MVIWINGAFGAGKTTVAYELHRCLKDSFVYDPENVGYFIRKNAPPAFSQGDFQDIPLWRTMNFEMLKLILNGFDGTLIVPMTLVNPDYYKEIITRLIDGGIDVRHFILYADKKTLLKRLKKRSLGFIKTESFAVRAIDRCVDSFDNHITDTKIITDNKNIKEIVDEIAQKCNITLPPDKRSKLKMFIDRRIITAKHIR